LVVACVFRQLILDADGDGPVATALKTNEAQFVKDPTASCMQRAALAREFGIGSIHFVPIDGCVLEYGVPIDAALSGDTLAASLKMRCETSGAAYALYWTEEGGSLVVSGSYVTPAHVEELQAKGLSSSFAHESRALKPDAVLQQEAQEPIATVVQTGQPVFVMDARTDQAMRRQALAQEYGVGSVCFIPVAGGVLEYGTAEAHTTPHWTEMPACPQTCPKRSWSEPSLWGRRTSSSGSESATSGWSVRTT
jgi:hypothetical protein